MHIVGPVVDEPRSCMSIVKLARSWLGPNLVTLLSSLVIC